LAPVSSKELDTGAWYKAVICTRHSERRLRTEGDVQPEPNHVTDPQELGR